MLRLRTIACFPSMWVEEVSAPLSWLAGYGLWQTSVIPGRVCSHLLLSTDGLGGRANFWNKHKHGFRVTVPANVPGEICSSICWPKTSSSRTSWVLCLSWPFKTFFPLYVSKDNSVGFLIFQEFFKNDWPTYGYFPPYSSDAVLIFFHIARYISLSLHLFWQRNGSSNANLMISA